MHREYLNAHKLHILNRLYREVLKSGKNEVSTAVLKDNINDYNNVQKLRYHALIFKVRRGTWGITSHGWAFLRGERDLPRYVYIEDNKIQAQSQEMINVKDLNRGEVVIANQFEYYNKDGEQLANLPSGSTQTALV